MIANKYGVTTGFRIPRGAFVIGMGVAALLISGCADGSGEEFSVSDLEGTWIQSGKGFEQGQSITWDNQKIVIETTDESGFAGYKEFTRDEGLQRETLNGVLGPDGLVVISDTDGFYEGRFINGNFVGIYIETGEDSTVMHVTFVRE